MLQSSFSALRCSFFRGVLTDLNTKLSAIISDIHQFFVGKYFRSNSIDKTFQREYHVLQIHSFPGYIYVP